MYHKRRYKICICSVLLGEVESWKLQCLKPTFLSSIDPYEYGLIPAPCGLLELLWGLCKVSDLVDHWTLVAKLHSLGVKPITLKWNRLRSWCRRNDQ